MLIASTSAWITGFAIPVLLALGGLLAWGVRSTIEDYREAERQLAEERRIVYQQLLEPFLLPLVSSDEDQATLATKQEKLFGSAEYRRAMVDATLFASDEVVRALGDMTNAEFDQSLPEGDPQAMVLWARLLLAIRRSVGNKGTRLSLVEILRPTVREMDQAPTLMVALEGEPAKRD